MRTINLKWILSIAVLLALPLWAANRNGILLTSDKVDATKEQKAEWKSIKKDQDEVMKMLVQGNKRHVNHVVHGGNPRLMVVSCADSHVEPESVFSAKLGDVFTIRAYGNVVDKVILASLEYGANGMKETGKDGLGIHVLVVMGHTDCTAIKSAIDVHDNPPPADNEWDSLNQKAFYEQLDPAVAEVEETQRRTEAQLGKKLNSADVLEAVVKTNVLNTMHEIRQKSPLLWHLEQKDILKIVGCIYHKDTGKVEWIKE
jgi:carbonic anhydrase